MANGTRAACSIERLSTDELHMIQSILKRMADVLDRLDMLVRGPEERRD